MKKPIIGINPYYYEHNGAMWNATKESYYQSVWQAGGTAFTLNYPNNNNLIIEIAEIIDGLLLVGGPDIPIEIYNGDFPNLLDKDVMLESLLCCKRAGADAILTYAAKQIASELNS